MKRKRKRKGLNGHQQVNDRNTTIKARGRVLRKALRQGAITNEQAKRIGRWNQAYYHLRKLAQAGVLKRTGYNTWEPIRRRGRPVYNI